MSSLAAARADNFYYPRDFDPKKHKSINKYRNSHPLGARARKLDEGILIIRFEVPFHIRCLKCDNMIAKGVRFNAEKKAVGKFHSTRIYEFSMKCHLCGNKIVCKTDPENTDYVFTEGVNRILRTENATDMDFIQDKKEAYRLATDAFYKLESQKKDLDKAEEEKPRLMQLMDAQDRMKNDYDLNLLLRKRFRGEKKVREEKERRANEPRNFAVELLPANAADLLKSKTVKFKSLDNFRKNKLLKREQIRTESIFEDKRTNERQSLELKKKLLPSNTQKLLSASLQNSRQEGNGRTYISTLHKAE